MRTVSGWHPAYGSLPDNLSQPTFGTRRRSPSFLTASGMVNAGTVPCRALNRGLPSVWGSLRYRLYVSARYFRL